MTTLRELYGADFATYCQQASVTIRDASNGDALLEVQGRLHYDFDANAKFISYYIPRTRDPMSAAVAALADHADLLTRFERGCFGAGSSGERTSWSTELRFAGRVFLYMEDELTNPQIDDLVVVGKEMALAVRYRGPGYAEAKSARKT